MCLIYLWDAHKQPGSTVLLLATEFGHSDIHSLVSWRFFGWNNEFGCWIGWQKIVIAKIAEFFTVNFDKIGRVCDRFDILPIFVLLKSVPDLPLWWLKLFSKHFFINLLNTWNQAKNRHFWRFHPQRWRTIIAIVLLSGGMLLMVFSWIGKSVDGGIGSHSEALIVNSGEETLISSRWRCFLFVSFLQKTFKNPWWCFKTKNSIKLSKTLLLPGFCFFLNI